MRWPTFVKALFGPVYPESRAEVKVDAEPQAMRSVVLREPNWQWLPPVGTVLRRTAGTPTDWWCPCGGMGWHHWLHTPDGCVRHNFMDSAKNVDPYAPFEEWVAGYERREGAAQRQAMKRLEKAVPR